MPKAPLLEKNNLACPFCLFVAGVADETVFSKPEHIFYKDKNLTAFVSSHSWPNNQGNALIITNQHFENIYDITDEMLSEVAILSKKIALAMKQAYKCDGISVRQHNEPAGNQDVSHYHFHIIPRYHGDNLYVNHEKKFRNSELEIQQYTNLLKPFFI